MTRGNPTDTSMLVRIRKSDAFGMILPSRSAPVGR
jgi:hypothetical protein